MGSHPEKESEDQRTRRSNQVTYDEDDYFYDEDDYVDDYVDDESAIQPARRPTRSSQAPITEGVWVTQTRTRQIRNQTPTSSQSPTNQTRRAQYDVFQAVQDQAVQDQAVQDQAVQNQAVQDQAVQYRAGQYQAGQLRLDGAAATRYTTPRYSIPQDTTAPDTIARNTIAHLIQSAPPQDAIPAREKDPIQTQVTINLPERRPTEPSPSNPEPGVIPEIPYYYGLQSRISLIASTISNASTGVWPRDSTDSGFPAKKRLFAIRSHDIIEKWESNILDSIIRIISLNLPKSWVSVHCVRIGFKPVPEDNPIVILIIVKPESTESINGESLVQEIKAMCTNDQITDVEVELAYNPETESITGMGESRNAFRLKGPFDPEHVFVGASIGPPRNQKTTRASSGTLAAYLSAKTKNGDDILLALTNDHVCFDVTREFQEKSPQNFRSFRYEDEKRDYEMYTPSVQDYVPTKTGLKRDLDSATRDYESLLKYKSENLGSTEEALKKAKHDYETFTNINPDGPRLLGVVYGTGGNRVDGKSGMPMDWGVIKVTDNDEFWESPSKLNRLPNLKFKDERTQDHIRARLENFSMQLGLPIEGSIPRQISKLRTSPPQAQEIFFKVGRTTEWTAGEFNPCVSAQRDYGEINYRKNYEDYDWGNTGYCKFWCFLAIEEEFTKGGDSGSLLFDVRGEAIGLFFGGWIDGMRDFSLVISLEVVFRDIERRLELTDIKFAHIPAGD